MAKDVLVPPLGQTTAEVTLVHWYKHEGDAVKAGEPLYAIETDKAVLDIEAPASGVLRNVTAADGEKVAVLSAIAVITPAGDAAGAEPSSPRTRESSPAVPATPAAVPAVGATVSAPVVGEQGGSPLPRARADARALISPRARRLAEAERLDWSALVGTGPEGAIVERDIRAALASPAKRAPVIAPAVALPPVTLIAEADCTELLRAQQQLAHKNVAVSLGDLLARIVTRAQAAYPQVNVLMVNPFSGTQPGLPGKRLVGASNVSASPSQVTLGVGPIQARPAVVGGQIVARQLAWLTLTFTVSSSDDEQAGDSAARFLADVTRLIEQPALLLA